jgi:carbamoyltransferase
MKGQRFDNIAGAFQQLIEVRVEEWVQEAINYTGIKTVCLSGGVFMNVKLNKKIMEMADVEKLFVLPSCGDETAIFGAAQLAFIDKSKEVKFSPLTTMKLGPKFSTDQIMEFIGENKLNAKYKVTFHEEIEKEIAKLLARNKVVARMAGSMEFGARALGNRSILANPSDRDVVMIINEQMKDRDFWMPFAASIKQEREHDYIVNPKKVHAGYMIMAFDSTKLAQKELFAGLHPYDFTCRPQIVDKEVHPQYHKIISEFEVLTGIGGVLNTSFNLHGLPIVLGPKEALYAFEHSGLEYMVLENYLISKNVNG